MSTSTPAVGIDHPTVVPTNFDPEGRDGELGDGSAAADESAAGGPAAHES